MAWRFVNWTCAFSLVALMAIVGQDSGFSGGGRSDPSEAPTAAPGTAAGHLEGTQDACKV